MTAAYLRIVNPGPAPVVVTAVRSPAGEASLHESRRVDGQMQMRELAELEVPGGGEAVLAPGGLHIMLMGLESTPVEGATLSLCLVTGAGEVCTEAPVRREAPAP
jgi:copper(I)-binding protein